MGFVIKIWMCVVFFLLNTESLFTSDTDSQLKKRLSSVDYPTVVIANVEQNFMPDAFVQMLHDKEEPSDILQAVEQKWETEESHSIDEYQKMRKLVIDCMVMQKNNQQQLERIENMLQTVITRLDVLSNAVQTTAPQNCFDSSRVISLKNILRDISSLP